MLQYCIIIVVFCYYYQQQQQQQQHKLYLDGALGNVQNSVKQQ